eukprot:TRINITY_DN5516_c0_g2_i1.p1 TRINITY_DN5516_c0_g2~~TRINITY_DN5516_c0_g2_i1.p1  ORF type:complete len:306 (+),score=100.85 TRINITY_DN5516_c0_g2_i1:28-918(+)
MEEGRSPLAIGGGGGEAGRGRGRTEPGERKRADSSGPRFEENKQGVGGGVAAAARGLLPRDAPKTIPTTNEPNSSATKPEEKLKPEEGESLEEANKRLIAHVKALQTELKKYMTKVDGLEQEITQYKAREAEIAERFKVKVKQSYEKGVLDAEQKSTNSTEIKGLKKSVEGYSTVLNFLVDDSPNADNTGDHKVIKVGTLQKQGNLMKGQYRKRLFLLRANRQLIYFSTKEKPVPRGILDLRECLGMEISKSDKQLLEILTPTGKFSLRADSKEQRDDWAQSLMTLMKQPQAGVSL